MADRRTRCGARDPVDGRRLDGVARRAGSHDHDGRRAARNGPVLTAHRADDPARQAEPDRDRPVRRDIRPRDARAARGASSRTEDRCPASRSSSRTCSSSSASSSSCCTSTTSVDRSACLGPDRARRHRHAAAARRGLLASAWIRNRPMHRRHLFARNRESSPRSAATISSRSAQRSRLRPRDGARARRVRARRRAAVPRGRGTGTRLDDDAISGACCSASNEHSTRTSPTGCGCSSTWPSGRSPTLPSSTRRPPCRPSTACMTAFGSSRDACSPTAATATQNGEVRLIVPVMDWDAFVNLAFDEIRLAGAQSPQVTRRLDRRARRPRNGRSAGASVCAATTARPVADRSR